MNFYLKIVSLATNDRSTGESRYFYLLTLCLIKIMKIHIPVRQLNIVQMVLGTRNKVACKIRTNGTH